MHVGHHPASPRFPPQARFPLGRKKKHTWKLPYRYAWNSRPTSQEHAWCHICPSKPLASPRATPHLTFRVSRWPTPPDPCRRQRQPDHPELGPPRHWRHHQHHHHSQRAVQTLQHMSSGSRLLPWTSPRLPSGGVPQQLPAGDVRLAGCAR